MKLLFYLWLMQAPAPPISLVSVVRQSAVLLFWADTANPAGTIYNVYRSDGACAAQATRYPLAQGPMTYPFWAVDMAPESGPACYHLAAVIGGVEGPEAVIDAVPGTLPVSPLVTVTAK